MDCTVLPGEAKALIVAEEFLPSPTVTQPFSKFHLHLPSSHAELLEALGYSMTEVNIKTASLKKTIAFTGQRSSNNLFVLFFLLLSQFLKKLFFFLLSILIFIGVELCILLLLILK